MRSLYIWAIFSSLTLFQVAHLQAQTDDPDQEIMLLLQGMEALRVGQFQAAIDYFNEAEKINRFVPYLYALRAQAHLEIDAFASAEQDLSRALRYYYQTKQDGSKELVIYGEVPLSREVQKALQAYNLYYQRGNANHHLNRKQPALEDLSMSLKLNPNFSPAARYQLLVAQNKKPEKLEHIYPIEMQAFVDSSDSPKGERPPGEAVANTPDPDDWRKQRGLFTGARDPKNRRERKQLEAFESERSFKDGMSYFNPKVGYASQNYIVIKSVQLGSRGTAVTFEVENKTEETYQLRLTDQMFITDRSGQISRRLDMKSVRGIKTGRNEGTELKPGKSLQFVVVFQPIPDDMHYLNIIEGDRNDGSEWNFYDISLK